MSTIKPEHREAALSIMEVVPLGLETVVAQLLVDTEQAVWETAAMIANTCLQEHSHLVDEYGERKNPASCILSSLESAARQEKGEG